MKLLLFIICLIFLANCSDSKKMDINKKEQLIIKQYLVEIKDDLSQKGYQLQLSEDKLPEVESFLSKLYKEKKIDTTYLDEYFFHFLIVLGEIYIQKHGGKWIFKKDNEGQPFPYTILCENGKLADEFLPILRDVLLFETKVTLLVELQPSYSSININCNE